jgi:hypothetical protein
MPVMPTNQWPLGRRSRSSLGSRLGLAGHLMVMGIWLEFRFKNAPRLRAVFAGPPDHDRGEK